MVNDPFKSPLWLVNSELLTHSFRTLWTQRSIKIMHYVFCFDFKLLHLWSMGRCSGEAVRLRDLDTN